MAVSHTRTANPASVAASGNVATYSTISIGAADPGRIVALGVATELTSATPNSATIDYGSGDVAMLAGTIATQGALSARWFYLHVPDGTTATFKVTFGANPTAAQNHVVVHRVLGGVFNASNAVADTDADPITTGSVTIPTNGAMLAVYAAANDATARTWTGLTEDLDEDFDAGAGSFRFSTGASTTGGAVTTTVSGGNNEDAVISWINFKPGVIVQAGVGSYAFSGAAATPKRGSKLVAASGSYAFSGTAAGVSKGRTLAGDVGAYSFGGVAATIRHAWKAPAASGEIVFSGSVVSIRHAWEAPAASGALLFSGSSVAINKGRRVAGDSGAFAFTGSAVAVRHQYEVAAAAGGYLFSGTEVAIVKETAKTVLAEAGAYLFSGQSAGVTPSGVSAVSPRNPMIASMGAMTVR